MDRAFEGLLRTGGGGVSPPLLNISGYTCLLPKKTWQIYKTNQNKVIDIKKIMLILQNVADVIKN